MNLKELQKHWLEMDASSRSRTEHGEELAASVEEAETEIRARLHRLSELKARFGRESALDFECGTGKLTLALATKFDRVVGIDHDPSNIEQAVESNQFGERCQFLADRDSLRELPTGSFDLVSCSTLQHITPNESAEFIREFARVARAGGAIVFSVPGTRSHAQDREVEIAESSLPMRSNSMDPLPEESRKARVTSEATYLKCAPGAKLTIIARVTNTGSVKWAARGGPNEAFEIHLGNHWRDSDGELTRKDDKRAQLHADVDPGYSINMQIVIDAPAKPGSYILQLDMVQEDVAWFAQHDSETAGIRIDVEPDAETIVVDWLPRSEDIHGVPRPQVLQILHESDAAILGVDEDATGGDWTSYRYFAKKTR